MMTDRRIGMTTRRSRSWSARLTLVALLTAASMVVVLPALAYFAGQTVWTQDTSTVNGAKNLSNFSLDESRPYDTNGKLTTDCSVRKWGFKVWENHTLSPDILKASVHLPISTSCSAWGARVNLTNTNVYHYEVFADGAGANFHAYVIAR